MRTIASSLFAAALVLAVSPSGALESSHRDRNAGQTAAPARGADGGRFLQLAQKYRAKQCHNVCNTNRARQLKQIRRRQTRDYNACIRPHVRHARLLARKAGAKPGAYMQKHTRRCRNKTRQDASYKSRPILRQEDRCHQACKRRYPK